MDFDLSYFFFCRLSRVLGHYKFLVTFFVFYFCLGFPFLYISCTQVVSLSIFFFNRILLLIKKLMICGVLVSHFSDVLAVSNRVVKITRQYLLSCFQLLISNIFSFMFIDAHLQ